MTALEPDAKREMLRHAVATLAYRCGKAIRDVPGGFVDLRIGETTRTPLEILGHIGDLLEWALSLSEGRQRWPEATARSWDQEVERFYADLARLDAHLASAEQMMAPAEKLFQGPIADALAHTGQIAMLRRMAAAPVRGENYFVAEIASGRVGSEQAAPRREFD